MICQVANCDMVAGYWISDDYHRLLHVCSDCGLELTARKQWRLVKVGQ